MWSQLYVQLAPLFCCQPNAAGGLEDVWITHFHLQQANDTLHEFDTTCGYPVRI